MLSACEQDPPSEFSRKSADSNATASDLLRDAQRNDPEAWKLLFDRYSSLIRFWCRKSGFTDDETDDVVQTAMTRVWVYLPKFRKDGEKAAFRRWLRTITITIIADRLRANGKHPRAAGGSGAIDVLNGIPEPDENSGDSKTHARNAAMMWEIMDFVEDEFQERTWRAFLMVCFEKKTSSEAAEALKMSPTAVRLAKARVLRRLRDEAERRLGHPPDFGK